MEVLPYWPADDRDHWLRHILEGKALSATKPRLKQAYLRKFLTAPDGDRPWEQEISGRRLSAAGDVRAFAEARAVAANDPGIKFRAVAYVGVGTVRGLGNWDVFAEPNDDLAHANLVGHDEPAQSLNANAAPKVAHEPYRALLALIEVCEPADISPLEKLRIIHT